MPVQHVTLNGHDVGYHTSGAGPVLLLVHGMAGRSATWAHVIPALGERFTVVAPDLLGHGESTKPRGEYSLGSHPDERRSRLQSGGATVGHPGADRSPLRLLNV
jgi:pimeloyl-ACP methyl ester carboxylesterase